LQALDLIVVMMLLKIALRLPNLILKG
jgi:hypothetical protein